MKYLIFKIEDKKVGVKNSSQWELQPTLINKSFIDEEGEYINFKRERIEVIDTKNLLFGGEMKKFDGLLFIIKDGKKKALKTESFFEEDLKFDVELNVDKLFNTIWE